MGLFDAMRGSVGFGGASNAGRMNRMNPAGSRFGGVGPSFMGGGMDAPNLGPAFGGAMGSIFGRRPSINEGGGIRFRPKRPFIKRGYDMPDMSGKIDMPTEGLDQIAQLHGSIGPGGGFGGMVGRLGKRQRRMAAEAARAQAAAPAIEG